MRVGPNRTTTVDAGYSTVDPARARELIAQPTRSLSREEAGYLLLYLEERGAIDFLRNRVGYGQGNGVVLPPSGRVTLRRVVAGVELRNLTNIGIGLHLSHYNLPNEAAQGSIDNCDVRMAVFLYKLACFLKTTYNVRVLLHMGIGHGLGAADDCHNQGRALDFGGVIGDSDRNGTGSAGTPPAWSSTAFLQTVRYDWQSAHIADAALPESVRDRRTTRRPVNEWPTWQNGYFVAVRDTGNSGNADLAMEAFRQAHPGIRGWEGYRQTTYRLATTDTVPTFSTPSPVEFFRAVYDFMACECSDSSRDLYDSSRSAPTTLGSGATSGPCTSGMIIHPDYPTSPGEHAAAWTRQTHYNHLHCQIGPTRPDQTHQAEPTTGGRLPIVAHAPDPGADNTAP